MITSFSRNIKYRIHDIYRIITALARGATYDDFSGQFFSIFEVFFFFFFCFVVALCDVHDVETIFHLSCVLTASGLFF